MTVYLDDSTGSQMMLTSSPSLLQLPLFDVFAVDLSPHVRQAACLALPALARRLQPHSFRQERALAAIDAFFHDEMLEIHATALEVLGELIYVFHDDPDGPPDALIEHFLGSGKKDAPTSDVSAISEAGGGGARLSLFANGTGMISSADDDSDQRPLVCAFNVRLAFFLILWITTPRS